MPTALITGASSGLGAYFARELAATHDLILVARREDRLHALRDSLATAHAIHVIAADLRPPDAADLLWADLEARDIRPDLIVNNAGLGTFGPFASLSGEEMDAMLAVNIRALTRLCRLALPAMVAAKRGAILNVASIGGMIPGPNLAVYYATKAYVLSLSEALHEEVRRHGIKVSALCPGPTRTEFADVAGMGGNPLFDSADDPLKVVRAGLRALHANAAVRVTGISRLLPYIVRLTPRWAMRRVVGRLQRSR